MAGRRRSPILLALGLALLVAACGSEGDPTTTAADGAATSTTAPAGPGDGAISDEEIEAGLREQISALRPLPTGTIAPSGFFQPTFGITFTEGWFILPPDEHLVCFVRDPALDTFSQMCVIRHPGDEEPQAIIDGLASHEELEVLVPSAPVEVDERAGSVLTFDATAHVVDLADWVLLAGHRYRYHAIDHGARTVLIIIEAPAERFEAFAAEAQLVLDTLDWEAEVVP